jgi:hypothetical protein
MLSVIMLSVVMQNVIMLSFVMQNVVMLSVLAPAFKLFGNLTLVPEATVRTTFGQIVPFYMSGV